MQVTGSHSCVILGMQLRIQLSNRVSFMCDVGNATLNPSHRVSFMCDIGNAALNPSHRVSFMCDIGNAAINYLG